MLVPFSKTIFIGAGEVRELYFYVKVNTLEESITSKEIKSNTLLILKLKKKDI